jgi:alkanesulfonate monooxygenase SsuD/methylene tetrahydromethanopterin reductase-like flavin-dependent oxidoreductase (luciferase family)
MQGMDVLLYVRASCVNMTTPEAISGCRCRPPYLAGGDQEHRLVRSFLPPMQQPHSPILLGGAAKQVFKRTVEYSNGWEPTRSTPEFVRHGRAVIDELAVAAGRDSRSTTILCGRSRHGAALGRHADPSATY